MRILIVQDTDWIRRNPIQQTHLAERLALRGHEIRVIDYEILWREEGKKELFSKRQVFHVSRIFKEANIKVIRPGILKIPVLDYVSMLFTYRKEINRQIKEFSPDIILGNDILTTYLAYRQGKKNNIPLIYYAIEVEHKFIPFRFLHPLGKVIESKNIKMADFVLAINKKLSDYTIKMGANPNKTHVIRAGVDTKSHDPKMNGKEIREKYGFKKDDKILFFVGWLYHFSGLKEVAIELSKLDDENIKLLIVGDGDAYKDLQKIREQYGVQDKMIMTGRQPFKNIPKFIASSDICILPAYNNKIMRDIVPIKMYDYMAMGKPVIATKLPGIMKEFGYDNGIIYVDKPEDVLKKAIELIENDSIEKEGKKARKFVEKYDWDKITDEFEEILKEVVRRDRNK